MKRFSIWLSAATVVLTAWTVQLACDNTPHPVHADNGVWIKCPSGGFCERSHERCGKKGDACDENSCCEVGDDGRAFGSKRRPMRGFAVDAGQ